MCNNLAEQSDNVSGVTEDLPQLVVLDSSFAEEVCELETRCYTSPWSRKLILGEFTKDISYRLGLRVNGCLVAYVFSYMIPEDLHLLNLAVAPEYRRQGCARYLLSSLLHRAVVRGVCYVYLEVRKSNAAAQKLYADFGFRVVGCRRAYYRDNGEDAFVLELEMSGHNTKNPNELPINIPPEYYRS